MRFLIAKKMDKETIKTLKAEYSIEQLKEYAEFIINLAKAVDKDIKYKNVLENKIINDKKSEKNDLNKSQNIFGIKRKQNFSHSKEAKDEHNNEIKRYKDKNIKEKILGK